MAGHMGSLLLLLAMLAVSVAYKFPSKRVSAKTVNWNFINELQVKKCPDVKPQKDIDKTRLLGVWFAYATTPLYMPIYQRRCASYNVEHNPYFNTNILFTDYKDLVITYSCNYDPHDELYEIKLRMLTRTRTPQVSVKQRAAAFLKSIDFPIEKLDFLRSMAYCFEWYLLKYQQRLTPGNFRVPMNNFYPQI